MKKIILNLLLFIFIFSSNAFAEILKKIEVSGNKRISEATIKVYGGIKINKDYQNDDINEVIKKLYNTNFFSNISTSFSNGILKIDVKENPIIYAINIKGEEAKKFKEQIFKIISLKEKGSYIENYVKSDIEIIKNFYKSLGYYSVNVDAEKQKADAGEDTLNLIFSVDKGERSKIKKTLFLLNTSFFQIETSKLLIKKLQKPAFYNFSGWRQRHFIDYFKSFRPFCFGHFLCL